MEIRKADGEEMLKLWGYGPGEPIAPTARFFCGNISSGNAIFWTVDDGGALLGELYTFLDIGEDRDVADGKTTAYLCAFRVKEGFRGRGLGSRLMDAALAGLRDMGFLRATIGVSDRRNEELYRRMGFDRKIKDCYFDPCAVDEDMRPLPVEGYQLLARDL